jgi:hypothetical protein
MLISSPYNPATMDLWLYEDHQITWTSPSPGSLWVKRPYAWNPNSWLYGYRKSLVGINATYRTLETSSGSSVYGANDASDPVNKPVFFNSFVPFKAKLISSRVMFTCNHWNPALSYRNPSATYANQYAANSAFIAKTLVRFIDHDDTIYDRTPADVIYPYRYVSPAYGTNISVVTSTATVEDLAFCELATDAPVAPMQIVDPRTCPLGTPTYYLDSNYKIIPLQYDGAYRDAITGNVQYRSQYVATAYGSVAAFQHDSGSSAYMEIKPPTSAAAGDGVLGAVVSSELGSTDFTISKRYGIAVLDDLGFSSQPAVAYLASLGLTYPNYVKRQRQNSEQLASEAVAQQMLSTLNTWPW